MINFQKNGFLNNNNTNNFKVSFNNSIRKSPQQIREEMIKVQTMPNQTLNNNSQVQKKLDNQSKQIDAVEQRNRLAAIRNISRGK